MYRPIKKSNVFLLSRYNTRGRELRGRPGGSLGPLPFVEPNISPPTVNATRESRYGVGNEKKLTAEINGL